MFHIIDHCIDIPLCLDRRILDPATKSFIFYTSLCFSFFFLNLLHGQGIDLTQYRTNLTQYRLMTPNSTGDRSECRIFVDKPFTSLCVCHLKNGTFLLDGQQVQTLRDDEFKRSGFLILSANATRNIDSKTLSCKCDCRIIGQTKLAVYVRVVQLKSTTAAPVLNPTLTSSVSTLIGPTSTHPTSTPDPVMITSTNGTGQRQNSSSQKSSGQFSHSSLTVLILIVLFCVVIMLIQLVVIYFLVRNKKSDHVQTNTADNLPNDACIKMLNTTDTTEVSE